MQNLTRARNQTRGQQPSITLEFIGAPPREAADDVGVLPAAWLAAEGLYGTGQNELGVLGGKASPPCHGRELPVPGPACLRARRGVGPTVSGIQENCLCSGPDLAHGWAAAMLQNRISSTVCLRV